MIHVPLEIMPVITIIIFINMISTNIVNVVVILFVVNWITGNYGSVL